MNRRMVVFILGWILKLEAVFLLLPLLVGLLYREFTGCLCFLITIAVCGLAGLLMARKKPVNTVFYMKEGCAATALGWILLSITGALPFYLSREIPSFTDALFETISGFTTTGASILPEVESLSHGMLFWRSFTHWLGGMGVLVFLLAVIKMTGGSHMNLMRAESPGPSVGKLVPKVKHTAAILYKIYLFLTVVQIVLLLVGGMPVFDAVTTAFGTAGTGGFGIKNDSMAGYSPYIQWITTVFMLLFGVNFNMYFLLLLKKWKTALRMEEVRGYFLVVLAATGIILANAYDASMGFFGNLRHVAFQVASIITTTGFSTVDFDLWQEASRMVLVMLMFIGACAGSTGGGVKVSRFIVLIKSVRRELNSYIYPKSVKKINVDGRPVEHEVIRGINVYFITFILIFSFSVLCLSFEGKGMVTSFTAVAATVNNIGPGLELVGPTQNFGGFTLLSKYVLMFDMLAGRLELFPLLLLFYPPCLKGLLGIGRRGKERKV